MLRDEVIGVLLPTIHPKIKMEDLHEEGRLFLSERVSRDAAQRTMTSLK